MADDERPFSDPNQPGRKDVLGVEWWACDPYPTWYRWDGDQLRIDHAAWPEVTGDDGLPVTSEEVLRVRRYECSMRGHSWVPVEEMSSQDPVAILCTNCGRQCKVLPADDVFALPMRNRTVRRGRVVRRG